MRRSEEGNHGCESCQTQWPPVTCPPRRLLLTPRWRRPGPGPLLRHLLGDRHDPVLRRRTVCRWPQRRLWGIGGPPGRRKSCGHAEGSPGRWARMLPAAQTILAATCAWDHQLCRSSTPESQDRGGRWSFGWPERCPRPRLRPTCSHCRAEVCQCRVGESQRAAPPPPPANAGERTARVVQGNGFHPTPPSFRGKLRRTPMGRQRRPEPKSPDQRVESAGASEQGAGD